MIVLMTIIIIFYGYYSIFLNHKIQSGLFNNLTVVFKCYIKPRRISKHV